MQLVCPNGHQFDGSVFRDDHRLYGTGWYGVCPDCGGTFAVSLPKAKVVMAFSDDHDPNNDEAYFTDWFPGTCIRTYYAFDSVDAFADAWYKMVENPDGMWYWVLDEGTLICGGACDPCDDEIFAEHFGAVFPKREVGV